MVEDVGDDRPHSKTAITAAAVLAAVERLRTPRPPQPPRPHAGDDDGRGLILLGDDSDVVFIFAVRSWGW
jgi:hypothetical protein